MNAQTWVSTDVWDIAMWSIGGLSIKLSFPKTINDIEGLLHIIIF